LLLDQFYQDADRSGLSSHRLARLFASYGAAAMMFLCKAHALMLEPNLVGNDLFILLRDLALSPTTMVPSSSLVPKASLLGMGEEALPMEAAVLMLPPQHVPWRPPATSQTSILHQNTAFSLLFIDEKSAFCLLCIDLQYPKPQLSINQILLSPCCSLHRNLLSTCFSFYQHTAFSLLPYSLFG